MSERLCPTCQSYGKCLFEEYVTLIVEELNSRKITDPKILLSAAIETHQKVSQKRIRAREVECPNLNNIDPDYPGKELL